MGKFVRERIVTLTFDGEPVTVKLLPLENADFAAVIASMPRAPRAVKKGGELTDEEQNALQSSTAEFLSDGSTLVRLLTKYVSSISGLTDAAGAPIEIESVARVSYFLPLAMDIVGELIASASVPDAKK